jgi:hypothetical protein
LICSNNVVFLLISKKEDYIVGTDQRRKTILLEQIKEGRPHCRNRSKKDDYIVGTDQRRYVPTM